MTVSPRVAALIKEKMADRKRNRRWWVQVAPCGAWRFVPAWYWHEVCEDRCPAHGLACMPPRAILDFRPARRPPVGQPLTGAGITEGNTS